MTTQPTARTAAPRRTTPPRVPGVTAGLVTCVVTSVTLAFALEALYGPGYAGYDAVWALVWGRELADFGLPSYGADLAPTPHPLANLVAVPLSLLGDGGESGMLAGTFVAFGALTVAAGLLGGRLFGRPAGFLAALMVATRPSLAREAAFGSIDLPFLALVVGAAAVEARRPRAGVPVLVLLFLAGLLRPEAWLLSALYVWWLARGRGVPPAGTLALAFAAPIVWCLSDLILAGDVLHSLTGTRSLSDELGRPTGVGTAIRAVPGALREMLGSLVVAAGIIGGVFALVRVRERSLVPWAIFGAGLLTFVVFGAAGLPVLTRYLLAPACMLLVLAGAAFLRPLRDSPLWLLGAGVTAALLLASVPGTVDGLDDARSFTADRGRAHRDLRALGASAALRSAVARCGVVVAPDFRARPVLALDLNRSPQAVRVGALTDGAPGVLVTYTDEQTRYIFNLGAPGELPRQPAPAGSRPAGANRSWVAYARC